MLDCIVYKHNGIPPTTKVVGILPVRIVNHMSSDKILVSKLSGKLSHFAAISTNPLNNEFCNKLAAVDGTTCQICYARRYLSTFRKHAVPAYTRNTTILTSREITENDFEPNAFFTGQHVRFLAYGELVNPTMFKNFCKIAEMYPYITATMWTKRLDIVQPLLHIVPENLRLIYSNIMVNPPRNDATTIPKGFDGVFNVYTNEHAIEHTIDINCSGSCATCLKCYTKNGIIINELIKEKFGNENRRYADVKVVQNTVVA
jgi:hypothetical protein